MNELTEHDSTETASELSGQVEPLVIWRYVLHPGYIKSKNDGEEHFIGGPKLARLYGVDIRECVFGDMPGYQECDGDIHLWPQYNGDYSLPYNAKHNRRE